MAHGTLHGAKHGTVHGTKHGSLTLTGVTTDASSGKKVPATAAEWAIIITAAGLSISAPVSLWLCQEASGNLADTIGSVTLTANASPVYQQTVSGWTRKAVGMVDGTANQRFASTAAALPDISTTSALVLAYVSFTSAPAAVRGVLSLGTSTTSDARHNTVAPRLLSGANTANGAATLSTSVRPWVLKVDRAASNNTVYTDQEKVTPTYSATMTGKQLRIGGTGASPANNRFLYIALFTGTSAELSDANVKSLLQTLGWSIPW